jgi:hypothetical protein
MRYKEIQMNNQFNSNERIEAKKYMQKYFNCVDYPREKDVDMFLATRKKLRELKIKTGEIILLDYKPNSIVNIETQGSNNESNR